MKGEVKMNGLYPIIIMLCLRGAVSCLLAIGGLYALNRGYHLFIEKIGEGKDDAKIQFGKFKASSKTIGSFVMITSCFWAFLSYSSIPSYKDKNVQISLNTLERFLLASQELDNLSKKLPTIDKISNDLSKLDDLSKKLLTIDKILIGELVEIELRKREQKELKEQLREQLGRTHYKSGGQKDKETELVSPKGVGGTRN